MTLMIIVASVFVVNNQTVLAEGQPAQGLYFYIGSEAPDEGTESNYTTSLNRNSGDFVAIVYVDNIGTKSVKLSENLTCTEGLTLTNVQEPANFVKAEASENKAYTISYKANDTTIYSITLNITVPGPGPGPDDQEDSKLAQGLYVYTGSQGPANDPNLNNYSKERGCRINEECVVPIVYSDGNTRTLLGPDPIIITDTDLQKRGIHSETNFTLFWSAKVKDYTLEYKDGNKIFSIVLKFSDGGSDDGGQDQDTIEGYHKYIDIPYDEETVLRYGYFYYNENGSLYCLGVSDNVVSNTNKSFNFDIGVGFFKNIHLEMGTADGIPSNDYFSAIHPTSHEVIKYNIQGGNVSFEEGFQNIKFGDKDAYRVVANIDGDAFGDLILLVTFELDGKEYTVAQYIVISDIEEKTIDLDITGMNSDDVLQLVNSTIGSMEGLQNKDSSIQKGTTQKSMDVHVRLINNSSNTINIYGNFVWGVALDNNDVDLNEYYFEVAEGSGPIIIHGSFINNGNTNNVGVNLNHLVFEGDGTGIAVNPDKGNIRIYNCRINNYEYGTKSVQKNGFSGYTQIVYKSRIDNCSVAIYSDVNSKRGNDFRGFKGNVFNKCGTAFKYLDLVPELSSVGLEVSENYFFDCNVDFDITHSSKFSGSDEYYLFPNNYYGDDINNVTALHYKSPTVVTHSANGGDCYVATSPSLMFPDSSVAKLGIDGKALTGMYSYVEYAINSRSLFNGATIVLFDQDTGAPCGTATLP